MAITQQPITQQLEAFNAFAQRLAMQRGEGLTLDEAYSQWKSLDPGEVRELDRRLAAYDAGERGRSVDEILSARRGGWGRSRQA